VLLLPTLADWVASQQWQATGTSGASPLSPAPRASQGLLGISGPTADGRQSTSPAGREAPEDLSPLEFGRVRGGQATSRLLSPEELMIPARSKGISKQKPSARLAKLGLMVRRKTKRRLVADATTKQPALLSRDASGKFCAGRPKGESITKLCSLLALIETVQLC
jgi:hypothetical protein